MKVPVNAWCDIGHSAGKRLLAYLQSIFDANNSLVAGNNKNYGIK